MGPEVVLFSDLWRFFRRSKSLFLRIGLIGSLIGFCGAFYRGAFYEIEARFSDGGSPVHLDLMMRNLFHSESINTPQQESVAIAGYSHRLLRPFIRETGLQIKVASHAHSWVASAGELLKNLWRAEWGVALSYIDPFRFRDVCYEGKEPLFLYLQWISSDQYRLFSASQPSIFFEAKRGEEVQFCGCSFILEGPSAEIGKIYALRINPWITTVREWRRAFSLVPHKLHPTIYEFRLRHPNGERGRELLNEFMIFYQNYLKKEHEDVMRAQFQYLDQRKQALYGQMAEAFAEDGRYVADCLEKTGSTSATQELRILGQIYRELAKRQLEIDIILEGRQDRDPHFLKELASARRERDVAIRQRDFCDLSLPKEKMPSLEAIDFSMDVESAKQLIQRSHGQLDRSEAKIRYLQQTLEKLSESDLSLSALGLLLSDPMSQHLSKNGGALIEQLRDEKNHSAKEDQRLREELDLQKRLFADHLSQLMEVEKIKRSVAQEKLSALYYVNLHGLNRQIALLEENIETIELQKLNSLRKERELITEKMEQLRREMGSLPDRCAVERQLQFKADASLALVSTVAKAVESHTISGHLHSISAKIFNEAIMPRYPARSHLFLFSFLGAAGAICLGFIYLGMVALLKGLPISREKLELLGYPLVGSISSSCDGKKIEFSHLESLRPIALALREQVVGLVSGRGPNYSHGLAELLGRAGHRILLIEADFRSSFSPKEPPGLLQFFEKEILSIRKEHWYDWVTSGGNSSFGTEYLVSKKFLELLEELCTQYDQILLFIRAPLDASETQTAFAWSQQMVVTLFGESIEQLKPFITWACDGDKLRLIFIACDEEKV